MANRILIKNACILSMDADVGDFDSADISIDGTAISQVGEELQFADAEVIDAGGKIAIPGFIDCHRHVWQANIRFAASDYSIMEYGGTVRALFQGAYTPDDKYLGNYAGCLEALDAGVTTIVDHDHNVASAAHADAAIRGIRDSRIRAVYCYGMGGVAEQGRLVASFDTPAWKEDDYARIATEHFPDADGRLALGMALNELPFQGIEEIAREVHCARRHGARLITFHLAGTGEEWVKMIGDAGLLGSDMLAVHGFHMTDRELDLLAEHGASVVATIEVEMQMGHGHGVTGRARRHGVNHALGVDVVAAVSGDMFNPMRLSVQMQRALANRRDVERGKLPRTLPVKVRDVLEAATLGGAKAAGLGDRTGSLTPGKEADIVLIDRDRIGMRPQGDPAAAVVLFASLAHVDTVLVAGEIVKRDGRLLGVDEPALFDRLEMSRAGINGRVREVYEEALPILRTFGVPRNFTV